MLNTAAAQCPHAHSAAHPPPEATCLQKSERSHMQVQGSHSKYAALCRTGVRRGPLRARASAADTAAAAAAMLCDSAPTSGATSSIAASHAVRDSGVHIWESV